MQWLTFNSIDLFNSLDIRYGVTLNVIVINAVDVVQLNRLYSLDIRYGVTLNGIVINSIDSIDFISTQ